MSRIIASQLDPRSAEFRANRSFMQRCLTRVQAIGQRQLEHELGYRERARKRGKLLPRERLALLLDPGAPFFELCSLAGFGMYGDTDGSLSGGKLIVGIGFVASRRCLVVVWNYTNKGGTMDPVTVKKMLRVQAIAFKMKLPIVSLHESGGGDLAAGAGSLGPWHARMFIEAGTIYAQQARLSAAGIVQVTVSHGNATAGGAYQVALSDYIVLVRNQTQLFLAGPPLLKAGTGEVATAEALGGAEMHAGTSGTGERLAENDRDAIAAARHIVAQLPAEPQSERRSNQVEPPRFDAEELLGIMPEDRRIPVRAQEIIARIVDGSRFDAFREESDHAMVCGSAELGGRRVGILSNNGPITPAGATKAAHFIALCDQRNAPLLFLQNTTGFLVGTEVERAGQVKHSAKMIQHVANAAVPKITVIVGNAYGAGNYAMASLALDADFVISWPTARQAVMGGQQAAKVMEIVTQQKWARRGKLPDEAMQGQLEAGCTAISSGLDELAEAMYCSARLMDDGIIDPRDTRQAVRYLLETALEARRRQPVSSSYGVLRL